MHPGINFQMNRIIGYTAPLRFLNKSLSDTVAMCTINVAKNLGIDKEYGSIKVGKRADFTIIDDAIDVVETIREGIKIYERV